MKFPSQEARTEVQSYTQHVHHIFHAAIIEEIPPELSTSLPLYVFNFVEFGDLDDKARHGDGLIGMHPNEFYKTKLSLYA